MNSLIHEYARIKHRTEYYSQFLQCVIDRPIDYLINCMMCVVFIHIQELPYADEVLSNFGQVLSKFFVHLETFKVSCHIFCEKMIPGRAFARSQSRQ